MPNDEQAGRAKKLPAGLRICEVCETVTGTRTITGPDGPEELESTCLCHGLVCGECGRRRIRRPTSDYFDPEDGAWWHVPYFIAMDRRCRECREAAGSDDAR